MKCEIVERIGQKSGKPYIALEVELVPGYKKTIFLEKAEEEMLKLYARSQSK